MNRPMRRKKNEITDMAEIEAVVRKAGICRLGLYNGDYPYIVPMNYGYEDGCLYFHCAREGRKLDMIRANPKVGFEIDESFAIKKPSEMACTWASYFESVIGTGEAEILEEGPEKDKGLAAVVRHYGADPATILPEKAALTAVIRVRILSMTGKRELPKD